MPSKLLQGQKRPSLLPKLAAGCVWYRSKDNPSSAAERGTAIDAIYRDLLLHDLIYSIHLPVDGHDRDRELKAAQWAADLTEKIARGHPILARRPDCQVAIPGFRGRRRG